MYSFSGKVSLSAVPYQEADRYGLVVAATFGGSASIIFVIVRSKLEAVWYHIILPERSDTALLDADSVIAAND